MKFSSPLILVSSLSLGLLGACGGGDASPAQRFSDASAAFVESFCACAERLGTTEEECREALGGESLTRAQIECADAVIAEEGAEVVEIVNCQSDASFAFSACVDDVRACDEEEINACAEALPEAYEDCGELSASVDEALADCLD